MSRPTRARKPRRSIVSHERFVSSQNSFHRFHGLESQHGEQCAEHLQRRVCGAVSSARSDLRDLSGILEAEESADVAAQWELEYLRRSRDAFCGVEGAGGAAGIGCGAG